MKGMGERARTVEVAELYPPPGQWKEEECFMLPDRNRILELSEGKLVVPPHPTYSHQTALQNIFLALHDFVQERWLGVVRFAPLPVRLWAGKIREPDVFFIAREHMDRIGEQACGVPDLVVEVTSPATRRMDWVEKFMEYAQAEVREYWIVDPEAQTAEVYGPESGAYELVGKWGLGQRARSRLLEGFEIEVDHIFA
jgi:Uma2 family endonuclease